MKNSEWRIDDLLQSMYVLFKHTPARRDDFTTLTKSSSFAKKYCRVRWLDNGPAIDQALKIFESFSAYVKAVREKKLPNPATKSFDVVAKAVDDPLTEAKLKCVRSLVRLVEPFLKKYQTDLPMLPFLTTDLSALIENIMKRFIKKDLLKSPVSAADLMNMDVDDGDNHISAKKVEVGFLADKLLEELKRKKKRSASCNSWSSAYRQRLCILPPFLNFRTSALWFMPLSAI
jgi:hypothetical protein